jgi:hypothetical protein
MPHAPNKDISNIVLIITAYNTIVNKNWQEEKKSQKATVNG